MGDVVAPRRLRVVFLGDKIEGLLAKRETTTHHHLAVVIPEFHSVRSQPETAPSASNNNHHNSLHKASSNLVDLLVVCLDNNDSKEAHLDNSNNKLVQRTVRVPPLANLLSSHKS